MARRRRKLNKRAVILASVLGLFTVVAVVVKLSGADDREALFAKANALHDDGKYAAANKLYAQAAEGAAVELRAKIAFRQGVNFHDWLERDRHTMTPTEQGKKQQAMFKLLQKAIGDKPNYHEARRYLLDRYWRDGKLLAALRAENLSQEQQERWALEAQSFLDCAEQHVQRTHEARTHYRLGLMYGARKRSEDDRKQAVAHLGKAVELDPQNLSYRVALCGELAEQDRLAEAKAQHERAIEELKNKAAARAAYARFLLKRGETQAAGAQADAARQESPDAATWSALGFLAVALKDPQRAQADFKQALDLDPAHLSAYRGLGGLHLRAQAFAEAVQVYRDGLQAVRGVLEDPEASADERRRYRAIRWELEINLANVLLLGVWTGQMDADQRAAWIEEAIACVDRMEQAADYPRKQILLDAFRGRLALAAGDEAEATRLLQAAYDGATGGEQEQRGPGLTRRDAVWADLLARLHERRGNIRAAERVRESVGRLAVDRPAYLKDMARRALRHSRWEKARQYLREAQDLAPEDEEVRALLGTTQAMQARDPVVPARGPLDRQLVRLLLWRAMQLHADQRRADALAFLEALWQRAGDNPEAATRLALMYKAIGRKPEMERVLAEARERMPDDPQIQRLPELLAADRDELYAMQLQHVDENYTGQEQALQRALIKAELAARFNKEVDVREFLARAERIDPKAVLPRRFRTALQAKDWPAAEELAERMGELDLDGLNGKAFRADLALEQAVHGDLSFAKALERVEEVIAARPGNLDARAARGLCYEGMGRLDDARREYEAIRERNPQHARTLLRLVRLALREGAPAECDRLVEQARTIPALRNHPMVESLHLRRVAPGASRAAKRNEYIPKLRSLLRRDPDNYENQRLLGELLEDLGEYPRAEAAYRKAQKAAPDPVRGAVTLARYYTRREEYGQVNRLFEQALAEARRPDTERRLRIAWAQSLAPYDPNIAAQIIEKAIALDPEAPETYWAKANVLVNAQKWSEALEALRAYFARTETPEAEAMALRMQLLWQLDKPKDALAYGRSCVADRPDEPRLHVELAYLLRSQGQVQEAQAAAQAALAAVRKAQQTRPAEPGVTLRLASLLAALGQSDEAGSLLEELARTSGGQTRRNALLERGRMQLAQLLRTPTAEGKWGPLESLLRSAREEFPAEPEFWLLAAHMYAARGQVGDELAAYEEAFALAPDSLRIVATFCTRLLAHGKHARLETALQEARLPPEHEPIIRAYRAALRAKQAQDLRQADAEFAQALKTASAAGVGQVAAIAAQTYTAPQAIERLERWKALRPKNWGIQDVLGDLYEQQGDLRQALLALNAAMERAKDEHLRVSLRRRIGMIQYALGLDAASETQRKACFQKAEAAYRKVLEAEPDDATMLNNLAYMLANDLNEPKRAEPYAHRAVLLAPQNPSFRDTYGWTLFKLGEFKDARKQLEKAVELERTEMVDSRDHLGQVLVKLGETREARERFEQALAQARDLRQRAATQGNEVRVRQHDERIRELTARLRSLDQ